MGQATGLALHPGVAPRDVDVAGLQRRFEADGVWLVVVCEMAR